MILLIFSILIIISPLNASESLPQKEPVRVGVYENEPKIFTDKNGVVSGIFAEILEEIARREGWELIYESCDWDECLLMLENGKLDIMPDVAYTPERDELFDFHSEEVVGSWSAVYARNREHFNNIFDLDGRRIAVLKGSVQQEYLEQMAKGFGFEVVFIEAGSFEEAYLLAAEGDAEAVVANHFSGDYFYQQYGLEKTPVVFNPVLLFYATTAGTNADLLAAIDRNLIKMKSEPGSIYYKAMVRWIEEPPKVIVPGYLFWIVTSVSLLFLLSLLFIIMLRWQVKLRTRHLADANKMLSVSEKMFHDIFHKHAVIKFIIDPDDGKIIEANNAAADFYGWSVEELKTMRIHDLNTLSAGEIEAEMKKARDLERTHFEFRHRLADGSIRDVAVFSSGIDINGKPMLHSIIHDITEHKQSEKEKEKLQSQLTQFQKMEAVGRLAGGVAHDYNNMLSVILGYSELAMSKTDTASPLHDDLNMIYKAARRSADITGQLLTFSRKQAINPKVSDLNVEIEKTLKMLRMLIGEDINLAWIPGKELWTVRVDPAQIDQIMANLCLNARDAIPGVGKITIETTNASFDDEFCAENMDYYPGDYVMIAVSDDGSGMDEETLEHLYEPFYTTKEVGKGVGLGLPTVYGIVRQNKGFISLYSEKDKGTCFRIYFPRHESKIHETAQNYMAEIPQGSGETVLLVEDDKMVRDVCRRMLEDLGYSVLEAETPAAALKKAGEYEGEISLLMTDVIMPEMSGRDLADRLQNKYSDLGVIFMSGYTENVISHRGVLDEGSRFIQKPFSKRKLAMMVYKAISRV